MESVGDTVIHAKKCRILTNETRVDERIKRLENQYIYQYSITTLGWIPLVSCMTFRQRTLILYLF